MHSTFSSCRQQQGMTLLEVLVGFVIFTSSLVAILNHVSNQVYLNHLSDKNQQKAQLLYDYSTVVALGPEALSAFASSRQGLELSYVSSAVDSFNGRKGDSDLLKTQITVWDGGESYDWSVYEIR